MNRVLLLALLALFGCEKKTPTDDKPPSPASEPPKPPEPAKPAPPAAEPEKVTKLGVLDLELATKGSRYTVRNAAFEIAFPAKPSVTEREQAAPDGTKVKTAMALASHGGTELGFFVIPVPPNARWDVEKGYTSTRDGALNNVGAKVVSEVDAKVGGLAGKKITATAVSGGATIHLEMHLAWDEANRQMLGLFTGGTAATPSSTATEFARSLKAKAPVAKQDPPAVTPDKSGDEKVTKTGVLGLELVEKDGMFTLQDGTYHATFPSKPSIEKTDSVAPSGAKLPGAVVTATIGSDQAYGMILILIPKGVPYDAKKGMKGARDGMINQVRGKVVKESSITIAGVAGKRTVATASIGGKQLTLELHFAYDKKRHAVFGLYTAIPSGTPVPASDAFLSSFQITRT